MVLCESIETRPRTSQSELADRLRPTQIMSARRVSSRKYVDINTQNLHSARKNHDLRRLEEEFNYASHILLSKAVW